METATYRLNEYRIIEHENGLLGWEAHYGFGAQQHGMCFIHNDILIIGPCSHEEVGYLKGEFLDRIEKLPLWNKTKTYCYASELLDVASGRSLNNGFPARMFSSARIARSSETSIPSGGPGTFQLAKYLIAVKSDGQVSWQAHAGLNRVIAGHCILHSGVLFLQPEAQEKRKEREVDFYKKLDMLPRWDRTKIWCPGFVLRCCQPQPRKGIPKVSRQKAESRGIRAFFEAPATKLVQQPKKQLRAFSRFSSCSWKSMWSRLHVPSSLKTRKPSSQLPREGNSWFKYLSAAGDFIWGLISSQLSIKKGLHLFRSCDRHHRK